MGGGGKWASGECMGVDEWCLCVWIIELNLEKITSYHLNYTSISKINQILPLFWKSTYDSGKFSFQNCHDEYSLKKIAEACGIWLWNFVL